MRLIIALRLTVEGRLTNEKGVGWFKMIYAGSVVYAGYYMWIF